MSEVKTDSVVNVSGDNDSGIDLSTNDVVGVEEMDENGIRSLHPFQRLPVQSKCDCFAGRDRIGQRVVTEQLDTVAPDCFQFSGDLRPVKIVRTPSSDSDRLQVDECLVRPLDAERMSPFALRQPHP